MDEHGLLEGIHVSTMESHLGTSGDRHGLEDVGMAASRVVKPGVEAVFTAVSVGEDAEIDGGVERMARVLVVHHQFKTVLVDVPPDDRPGPAALEAVSASLREDFALEVGAGVVDCYASSSAAPSAARCSPLRNGTSAHRQDSVASEVVGLNIDASSSSASCP